jgi:hypothetical protein
MASLDAEALDISYSNLIQLTLGRTLEGFVPNHVSGPEKDVGITEPYVGARIALAIYKKWGDAWVIDLIIDALLSWNDWLWRRRRGEGVFAGADGLADLMCLGSDPNFSAFPVNGGLNALQDARYESGLDNSPMYDGDDGNGPPGPVSFDNVTTHHMNLYDVGMTGLFLSDTQALIELAQTFRPAAVAALSERLARVQAALQAHLWQPEAGLFTNTLFNGSTYARSSPTNLFPLISGAATPAQAAAGAAWAASPGGLCLNQSHAPAPGAVMLSQWWGHGHDNCGCASPECMRDVVNAPPYYFIRSEAVVLPASAGAAPGRLPLALWFSATRADYALTNSTSAPPDAEGNYSLVRVEGYCFDAPPADASWGATQLTSWWSAERGDFQACGTPGCLFDAASARYAAAGPICWAWNGTDYPHWPCTFGGPSIARADAAFLDNSYWRGRIWGPQLMLLYLGLSNEAYAAEPAVQAARAALVAQGRALVVQEWTLFRQVTENYNGLIGVGEDVGNADPMYTWGALPALVAFIEAGKY